MEEDEKLRRWEVQKGRAHGKRADDRGRGSEDRRQKTMDRKS